LDIAANSIKAHFLSYLISLLIWNVCFEKINKFAFTTAQLNSKNHKSYVLTGKKFCRIIAPGANTTKLRFAIFAVKLECFLHMEKEGTI